MPRVLALPSRKTGVPTVLALQAVLEVPKMLTVPRMPKVRKILKLPWVLDVLKKLRELKLREVPRVA